MNSSNKEAININVPISIGELIDKITILEIKTLHMTGIKLKNIEKELELLKNIIDCKKLKVDVDLIDNLKEVNTNLWVIEDRIRMKESNQEFDNEFIELARSAYKENDRRALIKNDINLKYCSEIVEEKFYNNNFN